MMRASRFGAWLRQYADETILASALVVGLYLDWSLKRVAFLVLLTWLFLRPAPVRIVARAAVLIGMLSSVLILFEKVELAEQASTVLFITLTYLVIFHIKSRVR